MAVFYCFGSAKSCGCCYAVSLNFVPLVYVPLEDETTLSRELDSFGPGHGAEHRQARRMIEGSDIFEGTIKVSNAG